MLFMMCCIAVMAATCSQIFKTLFSENDKSSQGRMFAMNLLTVVMSLCFAAPVLELMFKAFSAELGSSMGMQSNRWTVWAVLVGSGAVAVYGYLLYGGTPKDKRGQFWPIGRSVVLSGVVIVGVMSSISHLTFFRSYQDGIANIELLRKMAPLKDLAQCNSGVAFVQFREDDGPIKYRCPTLLMFGGETSQPFAPWPDFVDGESQELAVLIHDTIQAAQKLGEK